MAKPKNFSQINTDRVYNTIAEATAEPDIQETQEVQETRKPRKEYTAQERLDFLQEMKTAGRKGVKLPRINLAFSPDVYEYIQIMSRVRGESMTAFVNIALRQHIEEHRDLYDKAIEFRNSL